jgi:hypothetical protein
LTACPGVDVFDNGRLDRGRAQMVAGPELAEAASKALGTPLEFKSINE